MQMHKDIPSRIKVIRLEFLSFETKLKLQENVGAQLSLLHTKDAS